MVMWVLATVGLTGILCGCLFRAPALVFLSFLSFGGGFVLAMVGDWHILQAIMTATLLTATLQLGYLLGAGLCYVRQHQSRPRGGVGIGHDFHQQSYSNR